VTNQVSPTDSRELVLGGNQGRLFCNRVGGALSLKRLQYFFRHNSIRVWPLIINDVFANRSSKEQSQECNVGGVTRLPVIQAPFQDCRKSRSWLLLAVLLALVALLGVYQEVTLQGDDMLYAWSAMDMTAAKPTLGISTLCSRPGLTARLAALYVAFGIHDSTTVALPLISSLAFMRVSCHS